MNPIKQTPKYDPINSLTFTFTFKVKLIFTFTFKVSDGKCDLTSGKATMEENCGDCDNGKNCKNDTWYKFVSPYNVLAVFNSSTSASAAIHNGSCNGLKQMVLQRAETDKKYYIILCDGVTCEKTSTTVDSHTCPTFTLYRFNNLTGKDCGNKTAGYKPVSFCLNDTFVCPKSSYVSKKENHELECVEQCPKDTYAKEKACVSCPVNSTSKEGSSSVLDCTCNAGTYKLTIGGNFSCVTDCPKAMFGSNGVCNNCSAHQTSDAGSTSKDQCICVGGYQKAGIICQACSAGTFSSKGSECKKCPDNANSTAAASKCFCNPGYNQTTEYQCDACPKGYYKSAHNVTCISCAQNKTSGSKSKNPEDCICKSGYFRLNATNSTAYDCVLHCPDNMVEVEGVCSLSLKASLSFALLLAVATRLYI